MENIGSVQSISRVFGIVELLGNSGTGMTISSLCEETGLHKSTVHRLLNALKSLGYVIQDGSGSYRLGFKLCHLSRQIINGVSLVNVARRHLKNLSETTRETVHLMMREHSHAVYLHREDNAKTALNVALSIGKFLPLHVSSAGKSILACFDEEVVRTYWETADKKKITDNTIDTLDALLEELDATRTRGYSIDNEENALGIRCLGISMPPFAGSDFSAISIAGLKERMTDARMEEIKSSLFRTRDDIMANMGYSVD